MLSETCGRVRKSASELTAKAFAGLIPLMISITPFAPLLPTSNPVAAAGMTQPSSQCLLDATQTGISAAFCAGDSRFCLLFFDRVDEQDVQTVT
jgi:hypothetical protein